MRSFLYLAAAFLIGCGSAPKEETSHTSSVADIYATWSNPGNIPVCFVDDVDEYQPIRDQLRNNIERNYNRTKHIRFSGWGICESFSSTNTIRIKLANPVYLGGGEVTGCSHLGPGPDSFSTCEGLFGNSFLDQNFNMYIYPFEPGTDVHEFGHALGLRHEHARQDAPYECRTGEVAYNDYQQANGRIAYITNDFDRSSVMGYCNQATDLSEGDIAGLDALYDFVLANQR